MVSPLHSFDVPVRKRIPARAKEVSPPLMVLVRAQDSFAVNAPSKRFSDLFRVTGIPAQPFWDEGNGNCHSGVEWMKELA